MAFGVVFDQKGFRVLEMYATFRSAALQDRRRWAARANSRGSSKDRYGLKALGGMGAGARKAARAPGGQWAADDSAGEQEQRVTMR